MYPQHQLLKYRQLLQHLSRQQRPRAYIRRPLKVLSNINILHCSFTNVHASFTVVATTAVEPGNADNDTTTPIGSKPTEIITPPLSPGVKAGIGVGVSLGVVGLVALGVGIWLWKKSQRRGKDKQAAVPSVESANPNFPPYYARVPPTELRGYGQGFSIRLMQELQGEQGRVELQGNRSPRKLQVMEQQKRPSGLYAELA